MGNEWAAAYAELNRRNEAARQAELRTRGGMRRTVVETVTTVYEGVRGEPSTERIVSQKKVATSVVTENFEVEES
jgi:hypothetical protein